MATRGDKLVKVCDCCLTAACSEDFHVDGIIPSHAEALRQVQELEKQVHGLVK